MAARETRRRGPGAVRERPPALRGITRPSFPVDRGAVATPPPGAPDLSPRVPRPGVWSPEAEEDGDTWPAPLGAQTARLFSGSGAGAAGWGAWRALGGAVPCVWPRLLSARAWGRDSWEKVPLRRSKSCVESWPRRSPRPGPCPRGEGRRGPPTVRGRRPDPGSRADPFSWARSCSMREPLESRGAELEPRGGLRRGGLARGGEPGATFARSSPRAIMDRKGRERCASGHAIPRGTVERWSGGAVRVPILPSSGGTATAALPRQCHSPWLEDDPRSSRTGCPRGHACLRRGPRPGRAPQLSAA